MKNADFLRFDRHEIFNMDDRATVSRCLKYSDEHPELENKLFGLYDGYLYRDLLELAKEHLMKPELIVLAELVKKILDAIEPEPQPEKNNSIVTVRVMTPAPREMAKRDMKEANLFPEQCIIVDAYPDEEMWRDAEVFDVTMTFSDAMKFTAQLEDGWDAEWKFDTVNTFNFK